MGQQAAAQPAPSPAPARVPAPQSAPLNAAEDAAVPDLANELNRLADVDAGGLGEAVSSVPNFIGDGCAPGASTSRLPVGRLVAVSQNMGLYEPAPLGPRLEGFDGTFLYRFPAGLDSVSALQAGIWRRALIDQ